MTFKPEPDNFRLLDAKLENFGPTSRLLEKARPTLTKDDIGKIFYSDPEKKKGAIVSNKDFLLMNPDDVGGWIRIGELDVDPSLSRFHNKGPSLRGGPVFIC